MDTNLSTITDKINHVESLMREVLERLNNDDLRLITQKEAADILSVSDQTLINWRKHNGMPCIYVDGKPTYTKKLLRDYIKSKEIRP